MRRTISKQYFYSVTLFDLTLTFADLLPLTFALLSIRSILICYLLHRLGSLLAQFRLVAGISPVSVADKAKSDDF